MIAGWMLLRFIIIIYNDSIVHNYRSFCHTNPGESWKKAIYTGIIKMGIDFL